jgi:hypothetical protein
MSTSTSEFGTRGIIQTQLDMLGYTVNHVSTKLLIEAKNKQAIIAKFNILNKLFNNIDKQMIGCNL